ncbi:GTPase HflX [Thiovibrio frasassiensis]|uniref:GTPase HflX n=1 Tax=Thiovibrio frasassiensis TaxID=2984131 RepID=A0A9X4MGY4_9BACT|nr:GTPase HflX [Thiovibrio frasassiensis]MDG4476427.1 GTPase HflX [Thiovibrio frasassiensis]
MKTAQLKGLERIAGRRVSPDMIISPELAKEIWTVALELGRQIGVLLSRSGQVEAVMVGDHRSIMIPSLKQFRSSGGRLKGLRCVHTHLSGEDLSEDDLMDLLFLRLDMMSVVKMDQGGATRLYSAHLVPQPVAGRNWLLLPPEIPSQQFRCRDFITSLEDQFAKARPVREIDLGRDRAILISVTPLSKGKAQESMDELVELARSAEVIVLDTVVQRREKINPRLILGKGKLGEIMLTALRLNANLLIFDQELNPSQVRSITDHTELRVIDRTQLILDIFARRALSREGKLQIEMAQLKYMLPRLTTRDDALSRLTGGIGGRGPGETRLEVDRRRINDRLGKLGKKLKEVSREREQRRSRRRKKDLPVLSLVGYTNAGKSTLLNTLTKSTIVAEDKLFATLDPTSRRLRFPEDVEVIITDTVGFIRNLPEELLKAFKATLEELHEADVLVHVIDLSNPRCGDHIRVVEELLRELELDNLPCLKVFNKIDLVAPEGVAEQLRLHEGVALSARDAKSFGPFLDRARSMVLKKWQVRREEGVGVEDLAES